MEEIGAVQQPMTHQAGQRQGKIKIGRRVKSALTSRVDRQPLRKAVYEVSHAVRQRSNHHIQLTQEHQRGLGLLKVNAADWQAAAVLVRGPQRRGGVRRARDLQATCGPRFNFDPDAFAQMMLATFPDCSQLRWESVTGAELIFSSALLFSVLSSIRPITLFQAQSVMGSSASPCIRIRPIAAVWV